MLSTEIGEVTYNRDDLLVHNICVLIYQYVIDRSNSVTNLIGMRM